MTGSKRPIVGKVFLGYRRDDARGECRRLYDELVSWINANGGDGRKQTFRDLDSIEPTRDYRVVLDEALHASGVFIALIGPGWLNARNDNGRRIDDPDDPVRLEIEAAIASPQTTILPLLVGEAKMPAAENLPASIRSLSLCQAYRLPSTGSPITPTIAQFLKEKLNSWTASITRRTFGMWSANLAMKIQLTDDSHQLVWSKFWRPGEFRIILLVDGEMVITGNQEMYMFSGLEWHFLISDGSTGHPAYLRLRHGKGRFMATNPVGSVHLSVAGRLVYDDDE